MPVLEVVTRSGQELRAGLDRDHPQPPGEQAPRQLPGSAADLEHLCVRGELRHLAGAVDQRIRIGGTVAVIAVGDLVEDRAALANLGAVGHDRTLQDDTSSAGGAMAAHPEPRDGYRQVDPDSVEDLHDGTDTPGEFRPLTEALDARQLAVTLVRVPPHTDFECGTAHTHEQLEELYLISRGTLTMRCGDDVLVLTAPAAVRIDPQTPRSHRNEGDEPVEMWAVSPWMEQSDSTKLPGFWAPSPDAERRRR